ncbi:trypsin-like peptidase domain-containing protein [Actinoplanes sp. GCM10030250]|uniref:trypsin-like peptidase domain-containing protein n=1 Tax=Actinoplanes sp. GCM10030250 TaxID=3273376 RepID=UPI0036231D4B
MTSSHESPERLLQRAVGKVVNRATNTVGSCFAIDSELVFTSRHVVRDEPRRLVVSFPFSGESQNAVLVHEDEEQDLAILQLSSPSAAYAVPLSSAGPDAPFVTFGYRHADDFDGLYSRGSILGQVTRASGSPKQLLQLQSPSLDRGMSGAPILVQVNGTWTAVGMVAAVWQSPNYRDSDLAFGLPGTQLIKAAATALGPRPEETYDKRVLWAVSYVLQDRYDDGAWGRSFIPKEGVFSTDARAPGSHSGKRALSVTSWAALALSRVSAGSADAFAAESLPSIMASYLASCGAFGQLHRTVSATPLVEPNDIEIANPRHTGSALSYLIEIQGASRVVARGLEFLVKTAHADGGWGEAIGGEPNTLATAYVIDAMTKCLLAWPSIESFFDHGTGEKLKSDAEQCVDEALEWLARRQRDDGTWLYRGGEHEDPSYAPAYTAYVVAFAPEVLARSSRVRRRFLRFVEEQVESRGGIPRTVGGEELATSSLMVSYGLRRTGVHDLQQIADDLSAIGVKQLDVSAGTAGTIASVFFLLDYAARSQEPGSAVTRAATRLINAYRLATRDAKDRGEDEYVELWRAAVQDLIETSD